MFDILPANYEIIMQQKLRGIIANSFDANGRPYDPDNFVIQPQQIRVHILLKPGQNSYTFDFRNGAISNYPMDVLLQQNDRFFAHSYGIQIFKQDVNGSLQNYGTAQRFTYPDTNYFVGANGGTNIEEWAALYTIYNGTMALKSNIIEYTRQLTLERCLYVPERTYQKQATPQINDEFPEYGLDSLKTRGLYFIGDFINLNGNDQNTETINLAPGDTTLIDGAVNSSGTAVTTRNVLCVCLEGYLVVQGAAPVLRY